MPHNIIMYVFASAVVGMSGLATLAIQVLTLHYIYSHYINTAVFTLIKIYHTGLNGMGKYLITVYKIKILWNK